MSDLLRNGRLASVKKDITRFTSSIKNDFEIFKPVIKINQAHIIMLIEQKIITPNYGVLILKALNKIEKKRMGTAFEDVHMYVEEEVINETGLIIGGNLHIAKSRNDQVSTAIRMTLREKIIVLMNSIVKVQKSLIDLAEDHIETLFPGYTHLQPAQPVPGFF